MISCKQHSPCLHWTLYILDEKTHTTAPIEMIPKAQLDKMHNKSLITMLSIVSQEIY